MSLRAKLKEIKERADAATQGNWSGAVEFLEGPSREDKDFIAHARTDVPFLLEMVRILKKKYWQSHSQHDCNELDKELNSLVPKDGGEYEG